jgi:3-deoxy-manno-octulosonate cytidylyltransferase (CMP-KDO synthetase)
MERVIIATDDPRIEEAARAFGAEVVLTSPRHPSGTDRVAEAVRILGVDADLIANIQGDEPFLDPGLLDEVVACAALPGVEIATAATPLAREEYDRPSATKVVMNGEGRALYFSRSPVPWTGGGWRPGIHWKHVGLYVYRRDALERFVALPPSALEVCESLEPLRAVEAGMEIRVVRSGRGSPAVDTPEDLEKVRRLLAEGLTHGPGRRDTWPATSS